MTLPAPTLSAKIGKPPNRATPGLVTITFDSRRRDLADDGGSPLPRYRSGSQGRVVCSICKLPGHARSNRKFHPRRG